jgi:hypothetical protein
MNPSETLKNHFLTTEPLRDILSMVVAKNPAEQRILARLERAYMLMGARFPSEQFGHYLDLLYTETLSVVHTTGIALAALATHLGWLIVETTEWSERTMNLRVNEEIVDAPFEVLKTFDPVVMAILNRCHTMLILVLAKASTQIHIALKDAKKKK